MKEEQESWIFERGQGKSEKKSASTSLSRPTKFADNSPISQEPMTLRQKIPLPTEIQLLNISPRLLLPQSQYLKQRLI
jgi:hypothetical protein